MFVQKGYVLVVVLIVLIILALLVNSTMTNVLLQSKRSSNTIGRAKLWNAVESTQLYALERLRNHQAIVHTPVSNHSLQYHESWWQQYANKWSFANIQTEYVIEDLLSVPCLDLASASEQGAHFYRVTVRALSRDQSFSLPLQAIIAIAGAEGETCQDKRRTVSDKKEGIQIIRNVDD